ncbi:MAG TPA: hypothetical protein PLO75_08390, partial [Thermotogota bacterium]|nr:hypothetical protein [Thermotogota bacterium]
MKELRPEDLDIDKGYVWKGTSQLESLDFTEESDETKDTFLDGLALKARNYNIFVTGLSGSGRRSSVKKWLESYAK